MKSQSPPVLFASYWFLVFAAVVITLYWLLPYKARLYFLLVASIVFQYHFAGLYGFSIIVILSIIVYLAGFLNHRALLAAAIGICAAALIAFKYDHFITLSLISPFAPGWGAAGETWALQWFPAVPPLAISFFTFEFIHYLYDVRCKGVEPIRNPLKFALFIFFFPTLVAGPIKRFEQFIPELDTGARKFVIDNFAYGLLRIGFGFFKKLVIADNLASAIEYYSNSLVDWDFTTRWIIFLFIGFRIYLDFSGYSDIAIGLARMLGLALPENFNFPYIATSLQHFWLRWHISLSTWIRDYIYIPLGGSRMGLARRGFNVLVVFAVCGLWHGAHWNFVLWGMMHGVGLCVNFLYSKIPVVGPALSWVFRKAPPISWLITMIFVFFSWILFFFPADQAWSFAVLLFTNPGGKHFAF